MKRIICPNCGFEFIDYDSVQEHIEEKPFEKQIREACKRAVRTGEIKDLREYMRLRKNFL